MNNLPRQKLAEIVARSGRAVLDNPRRCAGLLRDYCPQNRREIAVLVGALEERVAADLAATHSGIPREVLLAKLAQRLHDNLAMDKTAARWAVHSWALALGVLTNAEVEAMEKDEPPRPQPTPQPTPAPTPPPKPAAKPTPPPAPASTAPAPAPPASKAPRATTRATATPQDIIVAAAGGHFTSIGAALRHAAPGGRLRVQPGLYREGIVIDKPIEIIGDGARGGIIIESATAGCLAMRTSAATVRGLTLRATAGRNNADDGCFAVDVPQGQLTLEDCDLTSHSLSCVGLHNPATQLTMRRCRIYASADSGVYAFAQAQGLLEECDIYDNANVNVAITERAFITLKHCVIRNGKNAGLVAWDGGRALIEECAIFGNRQAGLGLSETGEATVRRSRIYDGLNSGVFVHDGGQATLEDCDIYHHAEPEVAVTRSGALILRQCKIHNGAQSGVFLSDRGQALLERCDVFANADAGVDIGIGGAAAISECKINGNATVAIRVTGGAAADVENSDLTGNRIAAWETEYEAVIESRGNTV